LEILWTKTGTIQVSDIANGFFLARFSNVEDYNRVAFEGPWKMFDYYITVAKWSPDFNEEEPIKKILIWAACPSSRFTFSTLWRLEGLAIISTRRSALILRLRMVREPATHVSRLTFLNLCLGST
ncbi:hypothetical protein LINPERHAP1_LOCUS16055, partial [Linum perenne]